MDENHQTTPEIKKMATSTYPFSKKINALTTVTPLSKFLALLMFVILPFAGFCLGINYQKSITVLPTNVQIPINTKTISTNTAPTQSAINAPSNDTVTWQNLRPEILKQMPNIEIQSSAGYVLTTSILSQDKTKVAFAEVSDCLTKGKYCEWKLNLYVREIGSGKQTLLYTHDSKVDGQILAYFPVYWAKGDSKLIIEYGNPTNLGRGGGPTYDWATLDINTKNINDLATYLPVFFDEFSKVIYVETSAKSPNICGPGGGNSGKIVQKDVDTGQVKVLLEKVGENYEDLKLDGTQLTYGVRAFISNSDTCSDIDYSKKPESGSLEITL